MACMVKPHKWITPEKYCVLYIKGTLGQNISYGPFYDGKWRVYKPQEVMNSNVSHHSLPHLASAREVGISEKTLECFKAVFRHTLLPLHKVFTKGQRFMPIYKKGIRAGGNWEIEPTSDRLRVWQGYILNVLRFRWARNKCIGFHKTDRVVSGAVFRNDANNIILV